MRTQLIAAIRFLLMMTLLLGVLYPLSVLGVSQLAFNEQANGSLVKVDGKVVGSRLIGQNFEGEQWFHPRPSAAGDGYDATSSSGSNLGPTNPDLVAIVGERAEQYREENDLRSSDEVPQDAVTTSASGLDPEISLENALLQAPRIAHARRVSEAKVARLIKNHSREDFLSFGGQERVNVVTLNIALAQLTK